MAAISTTLPQIAFSEAEWQEFALAICEALGRPPQLSAYVFANDAVVLSFSADWYAFVGATRGLNPESTRKYLPDDVAIVRKLVKVLQPWSDRNRTRSGGRFFISNGGVTARAEDGTTMPVATFRIQR